MDKLKKYFGIIWMITGPLAIAFLLWSAAININVVGNADINKPLPWIIIITIFTPVAIGLTIFGWYCWKGEYTAHTAPLSPAKEGTPMHEAS